MGGRFGMRDYSTQNKKAWEYNAYDFWVKNAGTPEEMAKKNLENPKKMLRKYAQYFDKFEGIKVANICGSLVPKNTNASCSDCIQLNTSFKIASIYPRLL